MSARWVSLGDPRQTLFAAPRGPLVEQRPRCAEAREVSAKALKLSRPAVGPPAHVVAHASARVRGSWNKAIALEVRNMECGEGGCKIKGRLARGAQAPENSSNFGSFAVSCLDRG